MCQTKWERQQILQFREHEQDKIRYIYIYKTKNTNLLTMRKKKRGELR